jgi:HD-like signal output (HDOD) protein
MADSLEKHAGIQLDFIDLSSLSNPENSKPQQKQNKKIDYKVFVKEIVQKILKNNSFLTFTSQINDVNRILKMKYSSANDIADVILKDLALTTKLLKLVNSSFYGQFSNKGIKTVSEAMIILGTEEIKLAAASLKIYELMQDIANIKILKQKVLKALQRSIIARQIAIDENIDGAEAIQISAMLYDFGEYLVALFSPDVFINIEIYSEEKHLSKELASKSIIGVSYSELGRFVASKWNLPKSIIYAMRPVFDFEADKNDLAIEDVQRYICAFTNDLCDIEFSPEGEQNISEIVKISQKYRYSLEVPAPKSVGLLKDSWNKITQHASILKVDTKAV